MPEKDDSMNIPSNGGYEAPKEEGPQQGIPEEKGNDSGPGVANETPKGDIGVEADGSYVGETAANPD